MTMTAHVLCTLDVNAEIDESIARYPLRQRGDNKCSGGSMNQNSLLIKMDEGKVTVRCLW